MTDATPDEQTVERVAAAMWSSRHKGRTIDQAMSSDLAKIYRDLARAAIAAMPDTKALEALA